MSKRLPVEPRKESSGANIRLVIIVAILLSLAGLVLTPFTGNPLIFLFPLAAIIPAATILILQKNRRDILDSGEESAGDTKP